MRKNAIKHVFPDLMEAQAQIARLEAQVADLQQQNLVANRRIVELENQSHYPRSLTRPTNDSARLNTLLSVGAALLVTHDIDSVLDLIVQQSTSLFPGSDGAILFLEDPDTCHLAVQIADTERTCELSLLRTSDTPEPDQFVAPRALVMGPNDLDYILPELHPDLPRLLAEAMPTWPPTSVLFAPLRDEQRGIGALLLYQLQGEQAYTGQDIPFVQTLADLVAVAVAEAHQRARAASLQRDLSRIQFLHREAQARLDTAQAQLLQSAKLAAVGELSASVAHEINNPLYAARNSLYLVEQDLPPDAPQRQFLDIAQGELGRIARIITRMRDFYRPSRAEYVETDVNSLLHDTVEFVQTYLRHNQITVVRDFASKIPTITAHGDQLRQVFLNLVLNACDAMQKGGQLTITTQTQREATSAAVVVQVADTGIGIPEEHRAHLFEPFYTTKPQGTGLGLAISAHIVTQHAGQILVDSTVNVGTTFTVVLPIDSDEHNTDCEHPASDIDAALL